MFKKISKTTIVILTVALLGFSAFLIFVRTTIPGEYQALATIAQLEGETQPVVCSNPFVQGGLISEMTKLAFVYKSYKRHEQAAEYFLRVADLEGRNCGTDYPGMAVVLGLAADSYEQAENPEKLAQVKQQILEHAARQKKRGSRSTATPPNATANRTETQGRF